MRIYIEYSSNSKVAVTVLRVKHRISYEFSVACYIEIDKYRRVRRLSAKRSITFEFHGQIKCPVSYLAF